MTIYIGMDDTDVAGSEIGTGHLARELMAQLQYTGAAVSRHQLLVDPRIPFTARNSANVVHLPTTGLDLLELADRVEAFMRERFQPGSDPGLCVVENVPGAVTEWGRRAQREVLTQAEARELAAAEGMILRGLGGTEGGVIGALAGVGLAASGNDGRFTSVGRSRELQGVVAIEQVLEHGISAVCTLDGQYLERGQVDSGGKVRPALRGGKAVLFVEPVNGCYRPVKLD